MTSQHMLSNPATSLDFTGVSLPLKDALGLIRSALIRAPNQQASYIAASHLAALYSNLKKAQQ